MLRKFYYGVLSLWIIISNDQRVTFSNTAQYTSMCYVVPLSHDGRVGTGKIKRDKST